MLPRLCSLQQKRTSGEVKSGMFLSLLDHPSYSQNYFASLDYVKTLDKHTLSNNIGQWLFYLKLKTKIRSKNAAKIQVDVF